MKQPRNVYMWMMPAPLMLFLAAQTSHGLFGSAQLPATSTLQDQAVIRVSSNLVAVPVSVTDSSGRPVRDLRGGDFVIEEDGHEQALAGFAEAGLANVELALLLDISGSVRPRFDFEQQAAARFLRRIIRPGDRFEILLIGPEASLLQSSTADLEQGLQSLASIRPSNSSTAFYDTVVQAAQLLSRNKVQGNRRAQVVLSDGEDNNSNGTHLEEALLEVQHADCVFYSINPVGVSIRLNSISMAGQEGMARIASQTGGMAFVPDRSEDLDQIFDRIATELRAQYLLEYYSSDQSRDGAFRRIIVRVPNRPGLLVRSRQGYFASQS